MLVIYHIDRFDHFYYLCKIEDPHSQTLPDEKNN